MTLEQFASQLEDSGVISAADIAAFQNSLSPPAESAEDLGKLLVKHKKVTKLQAQLVYQGKGDRLLLGNYLILDKIGAGGMGDVYLAEHRRMERRVALKTLPAAMTRDTQSILRFQREVKAAAKLTHPNIVTAYDADEANGVHYFVMEYVEGIDLSAVVKKRGVLNVDVAVDYILQAAKGLEFAHNKGVIHRDIKPANLLLDNAGTIKILDMGLARIEDEAHEIPATQLTQDGSVMGTVDYMAPEQAKDTHTADARSDIYSLGCSLYYLLTGESVYRGSTMVNRIMAHQNDPIPSLTGKHILISQDVDAVFQKMVAKKPEDRFQSMSEVIVALENCIQMKTSSTVTSVSSDPELQKFLQSQKIASSPTVVMSADAMTAEKPLTDTQNESLTSGFLNHTLGGTSYQPLAKRKKSIGKRGWVLMGAVLAPLIFMAGIVFKIDTPAGTIILEVDQPELAGAVVSVDEQKKITIKTGEGKEPIEVVADEKTHTLQVTKGGFETFTKQFTVKAGGKEVIKVRLVPLEVAEKIPPPKKENYALELDGNTSYLIISSLNIIDLKKSFTVELKLNSQPHKEKMNVITGYGDTFRLNWHPNLPDTLTFTSQDTLDSYYYKNLKVNSSRQMHIAIVYDTTSLLFFVNGRLQDGGISKVEDGISRLTGNEPIRLKVEKGRNRAKSYMCFGSSPHMSSSSNKTMKGIVDEVRISNVARYTTDFTPAKRFQSDENTIVLYHFDEGSGDLLKDASGNGHDGKIVGAKWVKVDDELQVIEPATTGEKPMTDREIAEWVIGMGGDISVDGKTFYSRIDELPTKPVKFIIINLKTASFEDHDLQRLAKLKTLVSLKLDSASISNAGLQYLREMPNLNSVYLDRTKITDEGLVHLRELQQLRTVSLQRTKIKGEELGHLKDLPSLKTLDMNRAAITNSGMKAIGDLKQVTSLNISFNSQIDDTGLGYIAGLSKLEELYAHLVPKITDEGLKHLQGMKQLETLTLSSTGITDAGLEQLAAFENLSELDIINCKITDSGLLHLKDLKNLKKLGLGLTPVTDLGLQHLHGLKNLESLDLQETKVTPQGISELQKALPHCKIVSDFETKQHSSVNHALEFNGESSFVEIKSLTGETYLKQKTDQFTIEFSITPDLPDSSNPVSYCVASFPFTVGLGGNKVNTAIHGGDAKSVIAYGSGSHTQLTEGRSYHIALLFSDGVQEIYINGKKQEHLLYKTQNGSTSKTTEKISLSTDANRIKQPTGIGAGNDLSAKLNYKRFFKGTIDEVRISNIARYSKDFTPASRFVNDEHTMALYHFDEGSGDVLKDSSGNGHDGKIVGARWVKMDDKLQVVEEQVHGNHALEFDGKTSYVDLPVSYGGKLPITYEFYIRPYSFPTSESRPLGTLYYGLQFQNRNNIQYWQLHATTSQIGDKIAKGYLSYCDKKITLLQRVHIAGVRNSDKLRLYVDGKECSTPLTFGDPSVSLAESDVLTAPFSIGASSSKYYVKEKLIKEKISGFFHGIIDEVRISNTARYSKEFTPASRFESDEHTMALYHFDEGSGDVLKDSSGNGHDGKIVGARWVKVDDDLQVIKPATTGDSPMTDREVAEWVIGMGGLVNIGVREFTNTKQLPSLPFVINNIKLAGTSVKDDDLKRLAGLNSLTSVDLQKTLVSDTGLQYLKDIPLYFLVLGNTKITDEGLEYLTNMPGLTHLYVNNPAISNSGVERLKGMKQLVVLNLGTTQIDDLSLGYLANLTNLKTLLIYLTRITDSGLKHLQGMKQLETLGLGSTGITDAGLAQLAKHENLKSLDITNCKITDSGVEHLKDLKNLKKLGLQLTPVTDLSLQHLHSMKQLESLELQETKVTPQGIAELQKALPNCKILSDFETKPTATEAP